MESFHAMERDNLLKENGGAGKKVRKTLGINPWKRDKTEYSA